MKKKNHAHFTERRLDIYDASWTYTIYIYIYYTKHILYRKKNIYDMLYYILSSDIFLIRHLKVIIFEKKYGYRRSTIFFSPVQDFHWPFVLTNSTKTQYEWMPRHKNSEFLHLNSWNYIFTLAERNTL